MIEVVLAVALLLLYVQTCDSVTNASHLPFSSMSLASTICDAWNRPRHHRSVTRPYPLVYNVTPHFSNMIIIGQCKSQGRWTNKPAEYVQRRRRVVGKIQKGTRRICERIPTIKVTATAEKTKMLQRVNLGNQSINQSLYFAPVVVPRTATDIVNNTNQTKEQRSIASATFSNWNCENVLINTELKNQPG